MISVEDLMKSSRRANVDSVREWIYESQRGPFEILRKIAEVSPIHRKILTLICDDLERLMLKPQPPRGPRSARRSVSKSPFPDTGDIERALAEARTRKSDLGAEMKKLRAERDALQTEFNLLNRTLSEQTFEASARRHAEEQVKREEDARAAVLARKQQSSAMYNRLWGENRHLRSEIERVHVKLSAHRAIHEKYCAYRANEVISSRAISDVSTSEVPADVEAEHNE